MSCMEPFYLTSPLLPPLFRRTLRQNIMWIRKLPLVLYPHEDESVMSDFSSGVEFFISGGQPNVKTRS